MKKLPEYSPQNIVWDRINEKMIIAGQEEHLHRSLEQLPDYDPPATVWESIEAGLPEEQQAKVKTLSIRRWAAVAAVFIAFSLAGIYIFNVNQNMAYVSVNYSEEKLPAAFLEIDWDADEDAFEMVAAFCKTDNIVCKQPAFKVLTEELEELNVARAELKYAMDQYGNDPDLIAQLTEIEHERSDILKKIIKQI